MNALGRHLLLELFDCDSDAINNLEAVKGALVEAAKRAQATIVDVVFHEFNPFGISGVVVIAESHLSIHTWPEYRYAAVDIFSCGDVLQPEVAANYLVEQFGAERTSVVELQRGHVPQRRGADRQQEPGRRQLITPQSYKWFFETTTAVEGHMHAIVRTIVEAQTKFQHVEIMETASYGKVLVLDGRIQSSQADEFIYHEALVHPGMLAAEAPPQSALVIGGGEGATLREILRYPSIRRAVMVDIDGEVVELCKKHLPEMHQGAFEDPRTELRHEDARAYLEKTTERFDFITIDLVEPLEEGPACLLFTQEFYTLVRDRLTPGGAMTMQAGMTKVGELDFFTAIHRTLRDVFPVVAGYQTFISCFGTPWGFIIGHQEGRPARGRASPTVDRLDRRAHQGPARLLGRPARTSTPSRLPKLHPGGHRRADPRRHRRAPADRHLTAADLPAQRGIGLIVLVVVAGLVIGSLLGELVAKPASRPAWLHDLITRGPDDRPDALRPRRPALPRRDVRARSSRSTCVGVSASSWPRSPSAGSASLRALPVGLVLASASPRRRELLRRSWPSSDVVPSDIEETLMPGRCARRSRAWRSTRRARWRRSSASGRGAGRRHDRGVDGDVLGKPADAPTRAPMLRRLRGRDARGHHRASPWSTPGAAAPAGRGPSRVRMADYDEARSTPTWRPASRSTRRAPTPSRAGRRAGGRSRRILHQRGRPAAGGDPAAAGRVRRAVSAPGGREGPAQRLDVEHLLRRRYARW